MKRRRRAEGKKVKRRAPARPTGSRELSIGQAVPCFIPPGSSKRGAKGQVGSQIKNFSFSPFKYNYIYASNGAKLISFFMTVKGEIKCFAYRFCQNTRSESKSSSI